METDSELNLVDKEFKEAFMFMLKNVKVMSEQVRK